ncbi:MAG TPA: PAS domain S-box protein [Caulobacteraceae bacterium]
MLRVLGGRLRMGAQLKTLLQVMDRLNAGDTEVEVPYQEDRTEVGRIAGTLEAFRRGLVEARDERRRAEQAAAAVRESEARYRMLADNSSDVILQYDLDFQLVYVSPSVRKLGYAPERLRGAEPIDYVHPDDLEMVLERRKLAREGGETKAISARLRSGDGSWRWFEGTMTAMRDEQGALAGFISTFRDIQERKLAEEALIDSEARYRLLADNVTDVLLRYGPDATVEYISPSVRQWGYEPSDFVGKHAGHYVHPDDHDRIRARRAAMLRGEATGPLEIRLQQADGTWTWIESKAAYIRGPDQAVTAVVLALRDISARKAADAALVDSEARYRILADNSSDVLLHYGTDLRIAYASPAVRQWGYMPEDFVGQPAGIFVHPDDAERVARRRTAMLEGELVEPVEARVRRADGTWTWIESNPALIRSPDAAVVGVVLVLRDINMRKRAEAALIESEARYRMLADNTSDIIQRHDVNGVVQYISPSVRQLGYEPEFFIGRPTAALVAREDLPEVTRRRQQLLSGKPAPPMESRVHAADGRIVWLESRPSPIFDDEGKVVGVVNTMRDITERKAAESALQELNLELRRVARASALGAFAGSLAHEINQPLAAAAVNGDAALRWLTAEPTNLQRGLQAARRAVEGVRRAADVVGRLRALVTKEEPNRAPFDAHEAIIEVLALTAREVERSHVILLARLDAKQALILGDRVQFQQVIINLILNAVEALRETAGERLLVIGSRDEEAGLELYVEDRGPGIAPDQQSQIFESMFTTKIGGTGLGLAIAKSIVESHGGVITMTPASPCGAVFWVRLPRLEAAAAAAELRTGRSRRHARSSDRARPSR